MSNTVTGKWRPSSDDKPIAVLTAQAIAHIHQQMAKKVGSIGIHLGVKKSGCSGYAYVIEVIDDASIFPHKLTIDNILVAIDEHSFPLVKGTKIDYIREGLNSAFKFSNPNESASCGCGESFSIEPQHIEN